MKKIITFILGMLLVIGIWFAVMGAIWAMWCWALPQVYAGGPQSVIAPSFWLFATCWTLASLVGRALFGGRAKS